MNAFHIGIVLPSKFLKHSVNHSPILNDISVNIGGQELFERLLRVGITLPWLWRKQVRQRILFTHR
jgi:hypothetical protein